jgi:hypothetical protein
MEIHRPRPIYYLFIATATEFVLAVGAVIALLIADLLSELPLSTIGFLLAYNALIATLVLLTLAKNDGQDKKVIVKGGGLILGHLVGLLLGGMLGSKFGGVVWAIIGAVGLYFIIGQIGSGVSFTIGAEIDRLTAPSKKATVQNTTQLARPQPSYLFTYAAVIPALFMAAAVFLKSSPVPLAQYPGILPSARIVVIALSIGSILLAWLLRTRWMIEHRKSAFSRRTGVSVIGLGLSLAPSLYGFLLFFAFGVSIVELGIFAVLSTLAGLLWVQAP